MSSDRVDCMHGRPVWEHCEACVRALRAEVAAIAPQPKLADEPRSANRSERRRRERDARIEARRRATVSAHAQNVRPVTDGQEGRS